MNWHAAFEFLAGMFGVATFVTLFLSAAITEFNKNLAKQALIIATILFCFTLIFGFITALGVR